MKRLLPCLLILLMASLLGTGCASSSGRGNQPTGTSASPTPPPGEVYTPPVAVPPSNP
jgi:hypothetical protein